MKKLITFSIIFQFHIIKSYCQQAELIRIDFVKLDNSFDNWGALMLDNVVIYDYLDKDGIPNNLKIRKQLKLFSIKYSLRNGASGDFRYKLLGLDSS